MVGAIIGKGGAKINEIRQLSGSVIKINEPQDNSNERLVTITGTQECNQMALYMLYSRLGKPMTLIGDYYDQCANLSQRARSTEFSSLGRLAEFRFLLKVSQGIFDFPFLGSRLWKLLIIVPQ